VALAELMVMDCVMCAYGTACFGLRYCGGQWGSGAAAGCRRVKSQ